ncbi:MAG: sulfurtransferase [Candidatus Aquicultorales bacterium]
MATKKHRLKHALLALACLMLVWGVAGCAQSAEESNTVEKKESVESGKDKGFDLSAYAETDFLITPQELKEMLGSKDLVLLDTNKPDVYAVEHIPGAVGIGLHAFSNKIGKPGDPGWGTVKSKGELAPALEALGIDNKKTVVFYSDVFKGPGADGRAVWQLRLAGLTNVKFLVGGLSYWKELGYEVTAEPAQPKPVAVGSVKLKSYDESVIATKEYVFKNLGKQKLIDVRSLAEYNGSQNAGEPRGGRIKGAVHMLWLDLLNKNGTPKSPDEIKKIMASKDLKPEDDFTVY